MKTKFLFCMLITVFGQKIAHACVANDQLPNFATVFPQSETEIEALKTQAIKDAKKDLEAAVKTIWNEVPDLFDQSRKVSPQHLTLARPSTGEVDAMELEPRIVGE